MQYRCLNVPIMIYIFTTTEKYGWYNPHRFVLWSDLSILRAGSSILSFLFHKHLPNICGVFLREMQERMGPTAYPSLRLFGH